VLARQLWRESGFVFVTDIGEPCDPRHALRALHAVAARAGLPGVGLHTLRHSAASVMLTHGVPLTVVSQILGHSGIAITADVYGHVAPEVSRAAPDVLADALDGASAPSVAPPDSPPDSPGRPDVPETPRDA
jgi:integrase